MLFLSGFLSLLMAGVAAGFLPVEATGETEEDSLATEAAEPTDPAATGTVEAPPKPSDDPELSDDTVTEIPGLSAALPLPSPEASPDADILWGDLFADEIAGLEGDDQINGHAGNDTLIGGTGDDILWGAAGDDSLSGATGDDCLTGEDGNDTLEGGEGADTLAGCLGDDSLAGGDGADSLLGGAGADTLAGGADNDSLSGNDGNDILAGGLGEDELFGDSGNDLLLGVVPDAQSDNTDLDGMDFLNGGAGTDTLMMGTGDWASGGEDGDLFALGEWIDPATPATITDYDPSIDQIVVVYDPDSGATPEVTIEPSDNAGNAWIAVNGLRLAEVIGAEGLDPLDVLLITPEEFGAV